MTLARVNYFTKIQQDVVRVLGIIGRKDHIYRFSKNKAKTEDRFSKYWLELSRKNLQLKGVLNGEKLTLKMTFTPERYTENQTDTTDFNYLNIFIEQVIQDIEQDVLLIHDKGRL